MTVHAFTVSRSGRMSEAGWHFGQRLFGGTPLELEELTQCAVDAILERKGLDVVIFDVRGRSSYADFLIVASGTSDRHVQAIAENVDTVLGRKGNRCMGREGFREGQWALVDFGSVVVHVFHQFTRQVFDLESMWKDAPRTDIPNPDGFVTPELPEPPPQWASSY